MADFGIGEMLLAEGAMDTAAFEGIGEILGASEGIGAAEAATAAGAAGAAEGAGALTAADLVGSGAISNLTPSVASGAFDAGAFQGIDTLAQADPVARSIQAANLANVTGDPMLQKVAFEGASPFQPQTLFNDYQDPSVLMQGPSQGGIDQLQQVSQTVSQNAADAQRLAEMGVKPIGMAPPGTPLGTVLPSGNVVGPDGMIYNGAQVAQGLSGTLETPGTISKLLSGTTMGIPNKYLGLAGAAAAGPMIKQALAPNPRYGINTPQPYTGALSKFKYDPSTYKPAVNPTPVYYTPRYAMGGPIDPSYDKIVGEPSTAPQDQSFASGGIAQLAVGGKLLRGQGDGMSDSIQANISGKREARLADGEFVVPADVVSHLGNGSTDAGAKQLYSMMDKVRKARTGRVAQGRQIKPQKYMPA